MRGLPPRPTVSIALVLLLAATIGAVAPVPGSEPAAATAASSQPNVVVILTDDQTLAQLDTMPSTRRLVGGRGLTFTEAIAPYPLCCPSRATLLTGRYATNHGVTTNTTNRHATPELEAAYQGIERASMPISLQDAGYFTGFVGKYLNGYLPDPRTPAGWDDWRAVTHFETYQNTTLSDNGQPVEQHRYMTDVLADETVAMIERASALDRPFFVQLSTYAPHSVSQGPTWAARHADLFRGVRAPRTPSFGEADTTDKRHPQPPLGRRTTAQIDRHWRSSLRSLQAVDEAVERVVDSLRATGELGNTMIVFTSDNGYFYGEHRFTHEKYLPYEPSIRVPWIVAGPMVPAEDRGEAVDLPIAGIDLVPTILHYALGSDARHDGRGLPPPRPRGRTAAGVGRGASPPPVRPKDQWVFVRAGLLRGPDDPLDVLDEPVRRRALRPGRRPRRARESRRRSRSPTGRPGARRGPAGAPGLRRRPLRTTHRLEAMGG